MSPTATSNLYGIRDQIKFYNNIYNTIQDSISSNYTDHDERIYQDVSKIINFIEEVSSSFEKQPIKDAILLLGNTGAGKSTLLNYLMFDDSNFIIDTNSFDGDNIILSDKSLGVEIGAGTGSTTLVPNLKKTNFGNFLDLAGDNDSGGILADILNSFIKSNLGIERVK
ncbi:hypothetical protein DICPUDRAFT_29471, partial [Dictyostelium purpureum]